MAAREHPGKPPEALRETRTEDRLVAVLRQSAEPLDTATLARRLDLHANGVRIQLHRLEARELVEREPARDRVGRPRDLWRLAPRAIAAADRAHTGWAMARSLARAIPATSARLREVEAAGVEMGADLADHVGVVAGASSLAALDHALEALGFEPQRMDAEATARYRLMRCPYAEAVRENPPVVCTLHKGIIRGVLERVAPDARLTAFEPRDPDVAGCIVEIATALPQT